MRWELQERERRLAARNAYDGKGRWRNSKTWWTYCRPAAGSWKTRVESWEPLNSRSPLFCLRLVDLAASKHEHEALEACEMKALEAKRAP